MNEKGVSLLADENRVSSGDLNSTFSPPNKAFEKSIEPLELANIAHFSDIPDFIEPTHLPYPIVVQSPSSLQCIDGWEMIEQAKQRDETSIICEIIHIPHDSQIEIAIWKASVRTKPLAGRCIYSEEIRNTCCLFTMLSEPMEDFMLFSHGGDRRGYGYIDRSENNIRLVLADRLGKSPNTISKYLQHANYLNGETLQALIDVNVKKGFFEAIQKDKQRLIDELESQQKAHDEIADAVSVRVLSLLEDFQASDLPEIVSDQIDPDEPPANENQPQPDPDRSPADKPIAHKHWGGNPSAALEKQPTEDEINQEFNNIGHSLIETAENQKLTASERIELFLNQIIRQSQLIQHLKHLLAQQSTKPEEQC
jgi:hypothetical protein